nr:MAG TPA: hypothetical protein [Caudoviricetes sp.]
MLTSIGMILKKVTKYMRMPQLISRFQFGAFLTVS